MCSICVGVASVRAVFEPRCLHAGDERSHTLKRTNARGLPRIAEGPGVNEAADNGGDSELRHPWTGVGSNQLVLETEGAEPGSTSVDGS